MTKKCEDRDPPFLFTLLLDPETFLSYKEIGCYKMNNKLFGPMLKDLRNSLDPSDKSKTVAECGLHAWKRARRIFAVGNGGVCYSSMNGHETYNRDGRSSKCVDNIGGDGEIFVYAINGEI